jgi:hypothetical protein
VAAHSIGTSPLAKPTEWVNEGSLRLRRVDPNARATNLFQTLKTRKEGPPQHKTWLLAKKTEFCKKAGDYFPQVVFNSYTGITQHELQEVQGTRLKEGGMTTGEHKHFLGISKNERTYQLEIMERLARTAHDFSSVDCMMHDYKDHSVSYADEVGAEITLITQTVLPIISSKLTADRLIIKTPGASKPNLGAQAPPKKTRGKGKGKKEDTPETKPEAAKVTKKRATAATKKASAAAESPKRQKTFQQTKISTIVVTSRQDMLNAMQVTPPAIVKSEG